MASDVEHVPDVNTGELGHDDKLVRKLRKKLRQIERLELLNRVLSDEEEKKVQVKNPLRQQLLYLLSQVPIDHDSSLERSSPGNSPSHKSDLDDSIDPDVSFPSERKSDLDNSSDLDIRPSSKEIHFTSTLDDGSGRGDAQEKSVKKEVPASPGEKTFPHEENLKTVSQKTPKGVSTSNSKGEKSKTAEKSLLSSSIQVTTLESHSDIITAIIIKENTVITASRDTTVKCWSLETGDELRSLGSHTESVTCLTVLTRDDCLLAYRDETPEEPVIISGSWDCTVKFWGMHSGKLLSSIYTFNPVTQVCFFPHGGRLITGSDGGKLELWDIASKTNVFSTRAHDEAVVGIKVEKSTLIYTCAANGIIQVHDGSEQGHLKRLFVSDNLQSAVGKPVHLYHIRCMELWKGKMLIGQDTGNVKIVDWKKGSVEKLKNHPTQFSFADAICCHDDTVVTSCYDLDSGQGTVNVRNGPSLKYCGTIDDKDTERILCVDFLCTSPGHMVIVTGGMELKLWRVVPKSDLKHSAHEDNVGEVQFNSTLSRPAIDSDSDDDDDDDDDDVEENLLSQDYNINAHQQNANDSQDKTNWMSWCTVL